VASAPAPVPLSGDGSGTDAGGSVPGGPLGSGAADGVAAASELDRSGTPRDPTWTGATRSSVVVPLHAPAAVPSTATDAAAITTRRTPRCEPAARGVPGGAGLSGEGRAPAPALVPAPTAEVWRDDRGQDNKKLHEVHVKASRGAE